MSHCKHRWCDTCHCRDCKRCFCINVRKRVTFITPSFLEIIGRMSLSAQCWKELSFPTGLSDLTDQCFSTDKNLTSVHLNFHVCFESCGLCEFHLPDSVKSSGGGAFLNCSLKNLDICSESSNFCVCDRFLDEKSTWRVCHVSDPCIPASVRELCDHCFYNCSYLRYVTFSEGSLLSHFCSTNV